jgi:glutathione S-transferase
MAIGTKPLHCPLETSSPQQKELPMKLYYSAGSCSTSCHISLEESGLKYEAIEVDWDKTADPNIALVTKLNPLGTLPVFITDEGKTLNQNIGIHTYIAEKAPDRKLLPAAGTPERAEAMTWLAFVSTDLHKGFGTFFALESMASDKKAQDEIRKFATENVNMYLSYLDSNLAGKDYLMGKTFTAADAYCFVVTNWSKWLGIPLDPYKNVQSYLGRVFERPAVQRVMKTEGLLDS